MTTSPLPERLSALAADYALGLLNGDERAEAMQLRADNPAFRAEVDQWTRMLLPMIDEVAEHTPPAGLFDSIASRLDAPVAANDDADVVDLRARLKRWQWLGGGASALAASLALAMLLTPTPSPVIAPPPSSPMVATLAGDGSGRMVAFWNGDQRSLVVAAASDVADTPGRAHELWLIPSGGAPKSVGVMPTGTMRITLPEPMAQAVREGATLAISVEPMGGSPTGSPTGPVIASGTLRNS